eukprot:jgi/Pico_ML_1/51987/g2770.t1
MIKVGKKLKKNNVAVDVVLFGNSDESNTAKVQAFHEAVNNEGNCALVTIPPGVILSDVLLSTPVFTGADEMEVDEDALLKQALQMSLADQAGSSEGAEKTGAKEDVDMQEGGEDELAAALKLSVQEEEKKGDEGNMRKVIHDSGYVSSVLAGLKGVDPNDKAVKDAVESLSPNSKKKENEDQDDKDKK